MAVAARPRSGRAQRARRWRAGGAPEASPSAPVRAWTAPSATPPGPQNPRTFRRRYSTSELTALNPGRTTACFQSSPRSTHGPFSCLNCNFSCDRSHRPPQSSSNYLRCILLNTRSARKHAIELWDLLDTTAPDVAFLTETWWTDSSAPDIAIAIPDGYKIARRDRPNRAGGGIAIAHKATLKVRTFTDDTLKTAEHLHFQVHVDPNTTLRGTLIYRPPGPRPPFSDAIADLASTHALTSTDYILLGDLNFHVENNNDINSSTLIDNLANLGLKQLVTAPTHNAGHTLDPIFSTSAHVAYNHTTELHWTDHHCIHFTFQKPTKHPRTLQPPRRCWSRVTEEQLTDVLAQNPPTNPTARNFNQWITDCANSLAPPRKATSNPHSKKAQWFTNELKQSKHNCRRLEKKWLHERTPVSLAEHKDATRQHHQLIRQAKRTSFKNRLDNNAHNSKELFNIVKELSNPSANSNDIPPSQELCNSLAAFFHRKITDIHASFPTTTSAATADPTPATTTCQNLLTSWTNINDDDTRRTMNTIHSGSPSDPCPHYIYNKAAATIAPQLRKIINSSFTTATFPEIWKHAEVNALLKKPKADPQDLSNFRPISLLPFPAKVIEKIVNAQLTRHLEDNNILDPSQSGFRRNHSTETALLAATDDIRYQLDNGETSALILLDLSAAFDTVCHRTLLTRLHEAGIRENALDWISSFLSGRTQRVRLPPFRSEATNIICGVPQGSSLSPTLFNVYMAPLAQVARRHDLNIVSYADDTQLILSLTKDPSTAKTNLHEGLKAIAEWMKSSRLKLNSNKTEVLLLGPTPSAWDDSWWPSALGTPPTPTDHARNLGFILDSSLSMSKQVSAVTSSCFYTLRMLRRIFKWIPTETRKTVTQALVTSRLDYGNALYTGIPAKHLRRLQRAQNASARLILDIPRRSHISPHLRNLHWLPIEKRITFKLLTHAHKALHNTGPAYLNSRLQFYTPARQLRSANLSLAAVPRIHRKTAGGRSFSHQAAKTWNTLPTNLRQTQDLLAFRRLLKTWLFDQ